MDMARTTLWHGLRRRNRLLGGCDLFLDRVSEMKKPNSKHASAPKLTAEQVIDIRKRLAAGEKGSDLAKEFGISDNAIHNIRYRKSWGHLFPEETERSSV